MPIDKHILLTKPFKDLTRDEWEDKTNYRGLGVKKDYQIADLIKFYPRKVERVEQQLLEKSDDSLIQKIERLKDKYACVLKEQELRKSGYLARNPIGTTYYIDLDAGSNSANGTSDSTPWLTLEKYTTTESRTAGDIAKVKGGTSETVGAANIEFDEDGTSIANIYVIGVDADWTDYSGGDARPIIDFNSGGYCCSIIEDNYWNFQNLDFTGSTVASGPVTTSDIRSIGCTFSNCRFRDNTLQGINVMGHWMTVDSCEFYSNGTSNLVLGYCTRTLIKDCIFNGGVATTNNGIYSYSGAQAFIKGCTFGVTTTHDNYSVAIGRMGARLYLQNCAFSDAAIFGGGYPGDVIYSEDHDQVYGAHYVYTPRGTVETESTIVRGGGATTSAKMSPSSTLTSVEYLTIKNDQLYDFATYCSSGTQKTISIYVRGFGWTGFPTNTQLYAETSYYSNAGTTARSTVVSTEVISDNTTWVALTNTFTPLRVGFAYTTVYLKLYEASSGVYVDIKPVVRV